VTVPAVLGAANDNFVVPVPFVALKNELAPPCKLMVPAVLVPLPIVVAPVLVPVLMEVAKLLLSLMLVVPPKIVAP
jgi:hypothetical protein